MKHFLLALTLFCLTGAFAQQPLYDRLNDGIVVRPSKATGNVKHVRLQVISDNIIKVTATAAESFSSFQSLSVLPQSVYSGFKLVTEKNHALLNAGKLSAQVSLVTGEITFKDASGSILLQEKKGGGKILKATVEGGSTQYEITQAFESPADEALYGLGGHQNGQMNYKGQDVELVQHNIVDVVPFLVSSRNYGLLWDNYSISYFGDSRAYQPLSSLSLFDNDGKAGGLTATYYAGDQIVRNGVEDRIAYEFLETPEVDNFPKEVAQKGKVTWEGSFTSGIDGAHKFLVYSSGYVKVWVDNKLVIDKWRQNWNPWTNKFTVDIRKGARHQIKIEWICEGGYLAVKHLDPLPPQQQSQITFTSEVADEINYYVIAAENADGVIGGYRKLTGKAPIVPSWAMGFWQSRERYRSQQEMIDVVKEYRERNIPLDNIVLDWQYWADPEWGSHEFDRARFPDPKGMINTLHNDLHANLMISVWPKFNKGTAHYNELDSKGFLFKRNIEKRRKDWVGIGYESTFYDPFNPEAGKMFWKQIDTKLNSLGVDAWWLDATEPDMHSNLSIEERKLNMSPTALGSGAKFFNAYSLLNSKSVYEGQRKSSPDKRVFILTRSAFAGQQRYGAATWSGDIVSRWSDMQDQIATGINFSLSGIPYWTMDIGGFAVESRYYNATGETLDEWRELNGRWFQFGAFCPLFRSHGQYPFREIYNIAPEGHKVYNSMVYYDKLRYTLMPYIYSLAAHAWHKDYTIMRGLIMDFPNDKAAMNIGDQYMFGPALLVNPVYEFKATSRRVYLPAGSDWFDLYTGKHFVGGQTIQADAPLDRMPVYVKSGSIIPSGPSIQYVNEKPADTVTLHVYAGKDGRFELYEDEGINYNYEEGKFSNIPIEYNEQSKTLTIGERAGTFPGMINSRKFRIVWVNVNKPVGVDAVPADQVIDYDGRAVTVKSK